MGAALIILLLITNTPVISQIEPIKNSAFCKCMYELELRDSLSIKLDVSGSIYLENIYLDFEQIVLINNYVGNYVATHHYISKDEDNRGAVIHLAVCLDMYNSRDFKRKIRKIVRHRF